VTPPTLIATYISNYNDTTTSQNVSVTTQAGDFLVVYAMTSATLMIPNTPTGNSITFTTVENNLSGSVANGMVIWSGTDATGGTNWTLNCQWPGNTSNYPWGFTCLVLRNTTGTDNHLYLEGGPTASPLYVDLETFNNNSAVVALVSDASGVTGTPTWLTVDGYTPTVGNGGVQLNNGSASIYYVHAAYYPLVSVAGINNYGISYTGSSAYFGALAVEIKGSLSAGYTVAWFRG
jgi:hypothetical protein